jgi:serine/threonine-protein kinase
VAVPLLEGIPQEQAINILNERGLDYEVIEEANREQPKGYVFDQNPEEGKRVDPETGIVQLFVSTGPPMVDVPDVVGKTRDEAVTALTGAGLVADVHEVPSDRPENTVIAQDPRAGDEVEEGSEVRINVSSGPKPVAVPPVVGLPFEQASSELQAAGFAVRRTDVDSNQPEGIVIAQDPGGNTLAAKNATVTLSVSKGPETTGIPDVESVDEQTAKDTLAAAGFKVKVLREDVDDPSLEGIVLSQDPPGGTEAVPGTTVTILVGRARPADTGATPP